MALPLPNQGPMLIIYIWVFFFLLLLNKLKLKYQRTKSKVAKIILEEKGGEERDGKQGEGIEDADGRG